MKRSTQIVLSALLALNLIACHKMPPIDSSPRHQALKTFDPHRKDFTCVYEADAVPPIDPEAETWHQQAMYVTRSELWQNQRGWKQAEALWIKATERKHWKAMMNLASLYETGRGEGALEVAEDNFRSIAIVEHAMALGIPAAFDKMGNYHATGMPTIRHNKSRAWAFWELAADMGNPQAMTHIGKALAATYDNPEEGFWGNMPVALKMLDCAVAQGFGQAAYELGITLQIADRTDGGDSDRALIIHHEGVKFGSEGCANSLFSNFNNASAMVKHIKDPTRARRYKTLADALYRNPDLRFPNLDKVIPLPPALLPQWDGQPQSLIDAAKAVVPVRAPVPTPGADRTGREHIPPDHVLPTKPFPLGSRMDNGALYLPGEEGTPARYDGYWLPQLLETYVQRNVDWNSAQVPRSYIKGETLKPHRMGLGPSDDQVVWHFLGLPQRVPKPERPWQTLSGLLRKVPAIEGTPITCSAGKNCPATGIWRPVPVADHPQRKLIDPRWRQAYLQVGQQMPDARSWGMDGIGQIVWHLLEAEESNEIT